MNRSGQSIAKVASYYDVASEDILIIHDEIDFPTAKITFKIGGSHAGHNGLRDTIEKL
jgi:PTH1 family peptidyl-tRNA hydrolase